MADTAINQLIVNKLTKEQFDSTTKNNNELYLVTDDDTYATVEQLNTKQNISNLSQSIDTSTTKYPSNNAVKTAIDNIDALPDQTGQGGKVLTTDGNTASWETINIPENVITSENYDNAKIWKGTEAEYNALASYDDNTTYIITDDYGTFSGLSLLSVTAFVNNLLSQVINDSNIGSNYVYIGDLLIQWGEHDLESSAFVTFPVAFANTNYSIVFSGQSWKIYAWSVIKSPTNCSVGAAYGTTAVNKGVLEWIAIGQGA